MKSFLLLLAAFAYAGTSQSQVTLLSNNTNLQRGFVFNGKALLIANNDSIWTTDGTAAGTYKLLENVVYADSGGVLYNNFFFFTGVNTAGAELWKTDGTVSGTQLIKDILPGSSGSGPANYFLFNNKVYFTANDALHGNELWTTDGTAAGTQIVKDIYPGAFGSDLSGSPYFTLAGNLFYFVANDGVHGAELWKSDGTEAGTSMVSDISRGNGSTIFFWKPFAVIDNKVLFTTIDTSDFSYNLYKTDGTSDGTILIKNLGANSAFISYYFDMDSYYKFNNKIYFTTGADTQYSTIWVTDGTTTGTQIIKQGVIGILYNAITINNKFYFPAYTDQQGGELWVSDGTTAGTNLLKETYPGSSASYITILQPFDFTNGYNNLLFHGKFFFVATNNTEYQLWISDGTASGTSEVTDLNTAGGSEIGNSFTYYYTAEGLYFSANKGAGIEPWFSDGTPTGTQSIADIYPGLGSSDPFYLFIYNDRLFLNANNGDNSLGNTDLYVLTGKATVLPVTLLQFSANRWTDAIHLEWITKTQENMDYYQVERSMDGANFTAIGQVKAIAGYSNSQTYFLDDKEALNLNQPVIYYRLRMVENNGSFKYSNIVRVDLKNATFYVKFAPNPVNNIANITIGGTQKGKLLINVTDLSGRTARQLVKAVDGGVIQFPVDVSGLAPGSYILKVINENNTRVQQFIKQ